MGTTKPSPTPTRKSPSQPLSSPQLEPGNHPPPAHPTPVAIIHHRRTAAWRSTVAKAIVLVHRQPNHTYPSQTQYKIHHSIHTACLHASSFPDLETSSAIGGPALRLMHQPVSAARPGDT
ncbi:hypothetical protein PtA15_8A572 [Puccinia triticina]|uniref:Uncharacterized protein n=1 Tax=Puccinia triticina TaxID=208348 RepID=A0ABY7CQX1_9BASI|nr:uncharacterized protein PtA15_8A572 [Puccinia triticina]WAQ87666.1 hypothetical protein PtA15_8A572 [Puccinia triticina]WAR57525.1 hypothetical protein PtB15_8B575 [Puccinia triticina]